MLVLIYLCIVGWCSVWVVGVFLFWFFDKSFLRNDLNFNMGYNCMYGNNMYFGMNMFIMLFMIYGDYGGYGSIVYYMM